MQQDKDRSGALGRDADEVCRQLPELGRFPVLYADPPWQYRRGVVPPNRVAENHYPTMPLADICSLPVPAVACPDAILFLWVTNPMLPAGLQVMKAWGFTYTDSLVWVKDRIGLGHWTRGWHELILVGLRGSWTWPPDDAPSFESVIYAPRGAHSVKPWEVYELIEALYPDLPRLELFARNARQGWTVWELEAPEPEAGQGRD